jgi:NAD(P)-dependent dehydrogenase (short-subunit alcohol dehydrogenase family)
LSIFSAFARAGATVVAADVSIADELPIAVDDEAERQIHPYKADISQRAEVENLVRDTIQNWKHNRDR